MPVPLLPWGGDLVSQDMGVSNAPPSDSSDPRPLVSGVVAGLPQETERGSAPLGRAPLERTAAEEGSGIAGGRGKMCAPEETWTTRSRAWR